MFAHCIVIVFFHFHFAFGEENNSSRDLRLADIQTLFRNTTLLDFLKNLLVAFCCVTILCQSLRPLCEYLVRQLIDKVIAHNLKSIVTRAHLTLWSIF